MRLRSEVNGISPALTRPLSSASRFGAAAAMAVSVGAPTSLSFSSSTVVQSAAAESRPSAAACSSRPAPSAQRTTVILFCVSVPVLSEQIT